MTGEATLEYLIPNIREKESPLLTNVRVLLITNDPGYAMNLQRTCLRWYLSYSWTAQTDDVEGLDDIDVFVIDSDGNYQQSFTLCEKIIQDYAEAIVVIVSSNPEKVCATAWPSGASAALLKSLGPEKVVEYIIGSSNHLFKKQT